LNSKIPVSVNIVNSSPDVSSIAIPSDSKFFTYTLPISFIDLTDKKYDESILELINNVL